MRLQVNRKRVVAGLLVATCVLGAAGALYAVGGAHESKSMFEGSLSPAKLKDFGWRVMNFIALLIILIKFLKKPLADALEGRRQGIADQFADLNGRKAEVERNYRACEAQLSKVDEQVQAILENAKAQAETEKARIIEEATRAAEDMKRKAEMSIQFELAEAQRRLRSEVVDQAVVMAEELIKKNLQESDHNAIVEDYLEKVGAIQ